MKSYIREFEIFLKQTRNFSVNTAESYLRDIRQFTAYCDNCGFRVPSSVKQSDVSDYISSVRSAGKSTATVTRVLASLRCYFSFLFEQKIVKENPAENIKGGKVDKKLPEILSSKEITTLLSQPDCSDLKGCRDKAMLELLYATGIKVSELISIKVSDINTQIGILHLHSDKSERIIPMYPDAIKAIDNYCERVRDIVVPDSKTEELFTNMNGQPMTRQGLWKIIKYYADKAKIKKDITPHTIRHSFAAHLLENGAPLKDIQEILGHSDLSSTQVYAQLMRNRYAQSYKKYHPLAR